MEDELKVSVRGKTGNSVTQLVSDTHCRFIITLTSFYGAKHTCVCDAPGSAVGRAGQEPRRGKVNASGSLPGVLPLHGGPLPGPAEEEEPLLPLPLLHLSACQTVGVNVVTQFRLNTETFSESPRKKEKKETKEKSCFCATFLHCSG